MEELSQPLTNVQLEILKAFSFNLNSHELTEFKILIAQYFADRAIKEADKVWDNNDWDDNDWDDKKVEELLNTKMRKKKN